MAHVTDFIIKGTRPKKPLVMLWGNSTEYDPLFKRSSDIQVVNPTPGLISAHALNAPLFTDPTTLWVDYLPEFSMLSGLKTRPLHQSIVFNCTSEDPEPDLDPLWKERVQLVSKKSLTPGTKAHKDLIFWGILREVTFIESDLLTKIIEVASPQFGPDFFYALDNLIKFVYQLPKESKGSVKELQKFLDTNLTPYKWGQLLNPMDTVFIQDILNSFFEKSRQTYTYMNSYYQVQQSPLPLLYALNQLIQSYLICNWAIRESQGNIQQPHVLAQGRLVPRSIFNKYFDRVQQIFQAPQLWTLAKDTCILQARYRNGEISKLPMYNFLANHVGVGL